MFMNTFVKNVRAMSGLASKTVAEDDLWQQFGRGPAVEQCDVLSRHFWRSVSHVSSRSSLIGAESNAA
jgi:hypothetical protein